MHARSIARSGILTLTLALTLTACGGAVPTGSAPPPSSAAAPGATATPAPIATPTPVATAVASQAATPAASGAAADAAEAEAVLLHGARLDLQGRCAPLREGLPAGAIGAITCTPRSAVAATVTMTILDTQPELMAAYGAVVAAEGIPTFSHGGRCEAGRASEGGYVPGDGHPGYVPDQRVACWIDEAGTAHSLTTSLPFVLLRVDGRPGASTADVGLYPMLGNKDQPGGPTLWAPEPLSPEK